MMDKYKVVTLALYMFVLLFATIEAKHYRGGTIYWSPVDDNNEQVKITYRLGFKLNHVEPGHDDCTVTAQQNGELLQTNGYLKCDECNNGQDDKIRDLEYVCTDYDERAEWAMGINSVVYDVPGTQFNISYENCCWVDLVSHGRGTGRGWKLAAAIDLRRRSDTGRINSSPISETLPVQFMERGCSYALQIPVIDPDNDDVRCRWPDMENECNQINNGACGLTPKARLKQSDCTMRFDTRKMKVGWHAVNLIIEDFSSTESNVPLSKVSLQFLISVLDSNKCNKPKVISKIAGTCKTIPAERLYENPLIVSVTKGRRVRSFTTMKPRGMTASDVTPLPGTTAEFYSLLTWTPSIDQIGKHTMCFQAIDNMESPAAMTCMIFNVMAANSIGTLTAEPVPSNAPDVNHERPRFIFNGEIQKPSFSRHITILDSSGVEIVHIDVTKRSADVTYEGRILEFGLPWDLLTDMDSGYQLVFDAGVAKGATKCGLESEPNEWNLQSLGYFAKPIIPEVPPSSEEPHTSKALPTTPTVRSTTPKVTTPRPTTSKPTIKPTTPKVTTVSPTMIHTTPKVTTATPTVTPSTPKVTTATPTVTPSTPKVTTATPTVAPSTPRVTTATPTMTPSTPKITPSTPKVIPTTRRVTTSRPPTTTVTPSTPTVTPSTPKITPSTPKLTPSTRKLTPSPTNPSSVAPTARRLPPGKIEAKPVNHAAVPECFTSSMRFYVSKKIVGEVDPINMHLIDPSCRGERHNDTHYVIGTSYGMCGTTFQHGSSGRKSNYNIMGNIIYLPALPYNNGSVMRKHNIEIHVNCTISSDYLTHAEFDPEVKTIIYYESGYGHFNFSLKMYKSDSFKSSFGKSDFPVDVKLQDRIYFQARSWARPGTELLLDSCRATPTANPFDEFQYTFIRDGCPVDHTVRMYSVRFSLRKRFSVSAFSFKGHLMDDSVFVHCDMRICDLLDRNSKCKRSCPSNGRRERRDVNSGGNSSAAYQDTDGPIRLVQLYEFENREGILSSVNADLMNTVMLAVVILLLIILIVLYTCGITCRRNRDVRK